MMLGVSPSERIVRLSRLQTRQQRADGDRAHRRAPEFLPSPDRSSALALRRARRLANSAPRADCSACARRCSATPTRHCSTYLPNRPRSTFSASPISRTAGASNSHVPTIAPTPMTSCRNSPCRPPAAGAALDRGPNHHGARGRASRRRRGAAPRRQCQRNSRFRLAAARSRSAGGRHHRAWKFGLLRALSQISRRDRTRHSLRVARPLYRLALSRAIAAPERAGDFAFAIGPQPRHR